MTRLSALTHAAVVVIVATAIFSAVQQAPAKHARTMQAAQMEEIR